MIQRDARDIMYAGAGVLWGVITVVRGVQAWRVEHRSGSLPACTVRALPPGKMAVPYSLLSGAALTLACTGYLLWRLFAI